MSRFESSEVARINLSNSLGENVIHYVAPFAAKLLNIKLDGAFYLQQCQFCEVLQTYN